MKRFGLSVHLPSRGGKHGTTRDAAKNRPICHPVPPILLRFAMSPVSEQTGVCPAGKPPGNVSCFFTGVLAMSKKQSKGLWQRWFRHTKTRRSAVRRRSFFEALEPRRLRRPRLSLQRKHQLLADPDGHAEPANCSGPRGRLVRGGPRPGDIQRHADLHGRGGQWSSIRTRRCGSARGRASWARGSARRSSSASGRATSRRMATRARRLPRTPTSRSWTM